MSPSPPPPAFLQTRYLFNIKLFSTAVFFSSTSLFLSSCDDFSGDDFEHRLKVPPFLFAGQHGLSLHCHHKGKRSGSSGRSAGWIVGKTGELLSTVAGRADGRKLCPACLGMILCLLVCLPQPSGQFCFCRARDDVLMCRAWGESARVRPVTAAEVGLNFVQPAKQSFPVSIASLAKVLLHTGNGNNNL